MTRPLPEKPKPSGPRERRSSHALPGNRTGSIQKAVTARKEPDQRDSRARAWPRISQISGKPRALEDSSVMEGRVTGSAPDGTSPPRLAATDRVGCPRCQRKVDSLSRRDLWASAHIVTPVAGGTVPAELSIGRLFGSSFDGS